MKCTICGAENESTAKFCKACGANLNEPSKEITVVTTQPIYDRFVIGDRFKILKKLGKGGMGEVLLAEDVKLKRKVAVKSILKSGRADTTSKIRFLREAQAASQLDHTNICTIYEIYEEDDKDFIVMQYIDGLTLDKIVGVKKLSIDKIIDICIQVCDGMIEAHAKKIMHRDIKPGNIIIDSKGVVKILDFGLAKFSKDAAVKSGDIIDSDLTQKGFVLGTVAYISPEQARGKELDKRTDIFSFGVVLYEMIEGENPFRVDEQIETLYNVLNKPIEFNREIPEQLKTIVKKTLERDREIRYQDFSDIKTDLEEFREYYNQLKDRKKDGGATEVINMEEQAKIIEEVQKSSDKENLGEMVYRIKKMKDSTERVEPTGGKKLRFLWSIPVAAVIFIAVFFLFIKNKERSVDTHPGPGAEKFYIYIQPFENKTGEKSLPEMLNYLLIESLNQFSQFKTIDEEMALSLTGQKLEELDLSLLKTRFNIDIKFKLTGKISQESDFYTIDARLKSLEKNRGGEGFPLTTTGMHRKSLLTIQIDTLTRQVYTRITAHDANNLEVKKTLEIFGSDWSTFSNFYAGYRFQKKLELVKSEYYLKKSRELLISKYYLADVYYFQGQRENALQMIDKIIPEINKLPPILQLKVQAIRARLTYDYQKEIEFWQKLKEQIPFSKEVYLELGEAHFHHANPREAINQYKEALDLDPNYSKALNHLGYCNSYLGKYNQAIQFFLRYRTLDQSANSFDSLGDGYFYSGDLVTAEAMKRRAVVPDENNERLSYPYQTLADINILKARYDEARKALNDYLKWNSSKKKAKAYILSRQAFIQYKEKRYPQALELGDQALQTNDTMDITDTTSPEIHWLRGMIAVAADSGEKAKKELSWLQAFGKKYNLSTVNFQAAVKYVIHLDALILESDKKVAEAEKRFRDLLAIKDKLSYWITYYNYQFYHTEFARFLYRQNRFEESLSEIDRCLEFNDPNFPYIPALWIKAEVLEKLDRKDEAQQVYNKIAESYGQSDEENQLRKRLREKIR